MDDVLDFTSGANKLGKPSAADLKLGLATGPVLFACQQVRLSLHPSDLPGAAFTDKLCLCSFLSSTP